MAAKLIEKKNNHVYIRGESVCDMLGMLLADDFMDPEENPIKPKLSPHLLDQYANEINILKKTNKAVKFLSELLDDHDDYNLGQRFSTMKRYESLMDRSLKYDNFIVIPGEYISFAPPVEMPVMCCVLIKIRLGELDKSEDKKLDNFLIENNLHNIFHNLYKSNPDKKFKNK